MLEIDEEAFTEIETDTIDPTRMYIPLLGGWEVQTKGAGSSYRLLDKKTGERHMILSEKGWKPLQEFFTRFANEVFAACWQLALENKRLRDRIRLLEKKDAAK